MSSDSSEGEIQREPDVEDMHNGSVRIVLDISDPVADLGIWTDTVSVEFGKAFVTDELAKHIQWEFDIDVEEYDIEVRE